MKLPTNTVRGRIRQYIEQHAGKLGDDVLEVGSRQHDTSAWWIGNRDLAAGQWTGVDMQPGPGVDVVADIHALPADWSGRFSAVLCSEVLEHVAHPWIALPELRRVLRPDGWLIVTTLFGFPEHGFPDDYYRYSRSGLAVLLGHAGFRNIRTSYAGSTPVTLHDHGERRPAHREIPMHTFAVAQC